MTLIYITGSHSSGKSDLLKSMENIPNVIIFSRQRRQELFSEEEFELLFKKEVNKVTVFNNLSKRLDSSIYETKKQFQLARKKSNSFIFADHFMLDCMAYATTCFRLGWLNKKDFDIFKKRFEKEFLNIVDYRYSVFFIKSFLEKIQRNFILSNPSDSRFWEKKTKFLETTYRTFEIIYSEYSLSNKDKWHIIKSNNSEKQKDFIIKNIYHQHE